MTMLCGSTTAIVIFPAGMPREEVKVQCRLDDAHTGDHRGRFGDAAFTWPRQPGVTVYPITSDGPLDTFANPTNAACVIKVNPPTPWASEPSNPIDDIRYLVEQRERERARGPQPMTPWERRYRNHVRALYEAAFPRSRPRHPEPFPIQDAGPHPKDAEQ